MHILSKKDLNSSELETEPGIEKSIKDQNSQWRSTDKWGNNSVCLRLKFIFDSTDLRGYVSSSIAWTTLRRSRILLWVGPLVHHHISFKNSRKNHVTQRITCQLLFQDYQLDLTALLRIAFQHRSSQNFTVADSTSSPANTRSRSTRSRVLERSVTRFWTLRKQNQGHRSSTENMLQDLSEW